MITQEQRNQRYIESSTAIQDLYGNPALGGKMREVFKKNDLSEDLYDQYAHAIGDVILGFYPLPELANVLVTYTGMEMMQARQITNDLLDPLSPLLSVEKTSAPTPGNPTYRHPDISETTDTIEPQSVHGYHAYRTINPHDDGKPVIKSLSQDDVLANKNRLANTPRYGEDAQT